MSQRMKKPALILIDGAPGLGKTTTVMNLSVAFQSRAGVKMIFCDEQNHPLHTFWNWGDRFDPNEVITDPFSPSKFTARLLERTYAFVNRLITEQTDAVVETYPFQSPVRNMLKMLGCEDDCADYFTRFSHAVSLCDPILVYFEHPAWNERIHSIAKARGDTFNTLFFDAFYRSPWGQKHGARQPSDVVRFYENYFKVCRGLLALWPHTILRLDPVDLGPERTVKRVLDCVAARV